MDVSDNSLNIDGKELSTVTFDLDSCAYVRTCDQQVPHNTVATTIVYGVLDATVKNERNAHKSRKLTTSATAQVSVVDKHLGTAWDQLQRFAVSWTVTKDMISSSAVPGTSGPSGTVPSLTVYGENTERNPSNFKREVIEVSAWQTLTTKAFDDELGIEYTLVESVVIPSAALPASTSTVWITSQRQVDALRAIRSQMTLASAYSLTRYETIQFSFPAILASWDGDPDALPVLPDWTPGNGWISLGFEEANERSIFLLYIQVREAFTSLIQAEIVEEIITATDFDALMLAVPNDAPFGTTPDLGTSSTRARLFVPRPRDISYNGMAFGLNVPNVLCDAATLTATYHASDTYYTGTGESFSYPASFPTASEYIALIGDKVCVEDSYTQWKYGLYKRRRTYVILQ